VKFHAALTDVQVCGDDFVGLTTAYLIQHIPFPRRKSQELLANGIAAGEHQAVVVVEVQSALNRVTELRG